MVTARATRPLTAWPRINGHAQTTPTASTACGAPPCPAHDMPRPRGGESGGNGAAHAARRLGQPRQQRQAVTAVGRQSRVAGAGGAAGGGAPGGGAPAKRAGNVHRRRMGRGGQHVGRSARKKVWRATKEARENGACDEERWVRAAITHLERRREEVESHGGHRTPESRRGGYLWGQGGLAKTALGPTNWW